LGAYRTGKLYYFGHSGSGFSEKGIDDALRRMKPLFTDKSPFKNPPNIKEQIQWVEPKLACEITRKAISGSQKHRKRASGPPGRRTGHVDSYSKSRCSGNVGAAV
jgi:ATP-dependent DNA ligase